MGPVDGRPGVAVATAAAARGNNLAFLGDATRDELEDSDEVNRRPVQGQEPDGKGLVDA